MKKSMLLSVILLWSLSFLVAGCGTGETGDRTDGKHGTTRPAPATDLSDTGNYRLRNKVNDEQRGDTLPEHMRDTAFNK